MLEPHRRHTTTTDLNCLVPFLAQTNRRREQIAHYIQNGQPRMSMSLVEPITTLDQVSQLGLLAGPSDQI